MLRCLRHHWRSSIKCYTIISWPKDVSLSWSWEWDYTISTKKSERAGKCHKFPVFSVSYKLDGPTGLEGITVLQNPWILPTAGGNPLDIIACQKVWNIVFWDCLLSRCAYRHTRVVAQVFSGVTFLSSSCGRRYYGVWVLTEHFGRKILPSSIGLMFLGMLPRVLLFPRLTTSAQYQMWKPVTATDDVKPSFSQQDNCPRLSAATGWNVGRAPPAPESGTFRSGQSCPCWTLQLWGRQGRQLAEGGAEQPGLLSSEPSRQLSRDQHGAAFGPAGKGALSSSPSIHSRSLVALRHFISSSWDKRSWPPLSETPFSGGTG